MSTSKWVRLVEANSRMEADLIESYLKANGIETQLIQESYESTAFGFSPTRAEIFVPDFQLREAQSLCGAKGWL